VFTVNGVTFDPVIITNSATVTWATNANGHIQATASGSGGGAGTNIFVNNVLIQPAKLTNSATVTWSTNSNGDIVATAATVTNSPVSGLWQKWGGIEMVVTNNNTIGDIQSETLSGNVSAISVVGSGANTAPLLVDVTFSSSRDTNYLVIGEFESTTSDIGYTYWVEEGTRASNSVRIGIVSTDLSVFATPGRKMRFNIIEPNATAGGSGGGGGDVYTSSNNVFTGSNTFNGPVLVGSTNVVTELANKQGLNANLTTVANLTSGTSTNFFAGDGTFKQVTTNMIPGLNATLASFVPSPTTTRGDMIYRGASADQRLAIGSFGDIMATDGTDPLWRGRNRRIEFYEEFQRGVNYVWASAVNAFFNISLLDTTSEGAMVLNANNNTAYANLEVTGATFGNGRAILEARVRITRLSSGGDFKLRVGFGDSTTSSAHTDGIWFEYTDNVNSGNWVGSVSAAGSGSSTNLAVGPAINTWYKLRWDVAADASSVTFSVDGANSATLTSANIPNSTSETCNLNFIANSTSANLNQSFFDYVYYVKELTTAR
jgi:hypothetical protein